MNHNDWSVQRIARVLIDILTALQLEVHEMSFSANYLIGGRRSEPCISLFQIGFEYKKTWDTDKIMLEVFWN